MKAIVLAAGKGTRLKNYTKQTPKPLLEVNGKSIIEHIITWLKNNNITEIGINLYTFSEQIIKKLGDGKTNSVNLYYIKEEKLSGTAGVLPKFKDWLSGDEDFLVVYGDVLTNQRLDKVIDMHKTNKAFATLLLHRRLNSNSFVEINANNRISNFMERPPKSLQKEMYLKKTEKHLVNSGIQVLNKKVIEYIEKNLCFDLPKDVFVPYHKKELICGIELVGKRVAIDSIERLNLAREVFK